MYRVLKRSFDILISIIILLIYLPIILIISSLVFLETKKFPIIIQERALSIHSKKIKIFKFRTLHGEHELTNKNIPLKRNELVSKVNYIGKWLRITGMDELPQLLNVIKGDMSIIGPRPLDSIDLEIIQEKFTEVSYGRAKLESKPGITGLWQIHKENELNPSYMYSLDMLYEKQKSFLLDLYILSKTLMLVLFLNHRDGILGKVAKTKMLKYSLIALNVLYVLSLIFIVSIITTIQG